jgi:transcriptional regulator with XRE-family HTH domain
MRKWLKDTRSNAGLTQKDIADKSGITRQHYNFIENNERRPSVQSAKKIAEVLGFNWTKFFEVDDADSEKQLTVNNTS